MILDMSGLAQKGGAVLSHVRLSEHTADVTCSRIVTGTADLVMAADEVVAAAKETITLCESSRTDGVINTHLIPTADFILNRDFNFQSRKVNSVLETELRKDSSFFDFTKPAEVLLGEFHRHQHHDARLCLSEGPAAAVGKGHRAGDRGQRRRDQDEHAGVPARPSRRSRSRAAGRHDEGPGRDGATEDAGRDVARRDHRAPQRASDRVSGCEARHTLPGPGDAGPRRRDRRVVSAMRCRARLRSTTQNCSPTRTNTRSHGCLPTAGSKSSFATSSRATSSSTSTSRRRSSAAASMRSAGRRSAPSVRG